MIGLQHEPARCSSSPYKSIKSSSQSSATVFGTTRSLTPPKPIRGETVAGTIRLNLVFLALSLVGCGQRLPTVSGSVALDGELVRGSDNLQCIVLFFPENGNGAPAIANVDGSGKFMLETGSTKGALEGKYDVAISVAEIIPSKDGGNPHIRQLAAEKYADPSTSGWTVEVVPGSNEFDFAIEKGDQNRRLSNNDG
ncbi:hypothetical protein [Bythopirellula polymerisocia]|uniref:Carboxypeptidase regulatory-like domain-containing protein n=1 Tax=Bythopirellula polymerisocia TaxID=2528003 RepID=A0A5C6CEG4_9BACT|nr:hypothetical protein [Bythopirellula polymerisocia]TWU21821.1 hypothetical protein Pla144_45170 [Bythopirellula polymerisocia]